MTTTVHDLLSIMSVRLGLQESGITSPHASVARATKQLTERLQSLHPDEEIAISYQTNPFHAQYVRVLTGEILAEISGDEQSAI